MTASIIWLNVMLGSAAGAATWYGLGKGWDDLANGVIGGTLVGAVVGAACVAVTVSPAVAAAGLAAFGMVGVVVVFAMGFAHRRL